MTIDSPIWPSQLDHLCLNSDDPKMLAEYYSNAFGYHKLAISEDTYLLQGKERRLVIGKGSPGERPYHGFKLQTYDQLQQVRSFFLSQGLELLESPSIVFDKEAVAIRDPDGWLCIFGLPRADLPPYPATSIATANNLAGRLQHVVVATNNLPSMMKFFENILGYIPSDYCDVDINDPYSRKVAFYRSDPEHHSFAVFAGSEVRADHHSYEVDCWNDIRDWADHMSAINIDIWWGPGRHGPGNNLFFMIRDPHDNQVEISAEIELMPREMTPRVWPLEERTLNLWGAGWIRD